MSAPLPETPVGSSWKGWTIRIVATLAILGFSLWYIITHTDLTWEQLKRAILAIEPLWLLAGVTATMGAHLARAERWRTLIPNGAGIPLWRAFSATIIGYMMSNIIPRSGEAVRPWVLSRSSGRPLGTLLATVLVERMLDGATLVAIVVTLIFTEQSRFDQVFHGYSRAAILGSIIIPLLLLAVVVLVMLKTSLGERLSGWIGGKLPERFREKVRAFPDDFRAGVAVRGAVGTFRLLLWTVAIWAGYTLAVYFAFLSFGFDTSFGLGFGEALPVLAITAVGVTIAPTPGAFGVYHLFCITALTVLYGVSAADAAAFAIVTHATPYLVVMVAGVLLFFRERISFRDAFRRGIS